MKKTILIHRILTGLLIAFFGLGAIPNILKVNDAIVLFKHLNLPVYLLPFLGVAKLLGCITLLVPGNPRLKEWVYAGLTFDLTGAIFCSLSSGEPVLSVSPMLIGFVLIFGSYIYYHRRRAGQAGPSGNVVRPELVGSVKFSDR
jgi:uncharacterized membrane protein YphA (DoxX/SURF4 family)